MRDSDDPVLADPVDKICSLEQLLAWREQAAAAGRKVVQCHGCFDIVHPGHVQYLQFAKNQGDLLLVSLSGDDFVNKGVDRPLIGQDLRAQSLAALACVDRVYVNQHPTAIQLLQQVRPDVYIKGREYEKNQDPRFEAEQQAVMSHGGQVLFSSGEVVFSSTELIHSLQRDDYLCGHKIERFCRRNQIDARQLEPIIERCRGLKVMVIGDYVLDRYQRCEAAALADDGPMLSLRPLRQQEFDGGAGAIATQLAALGAQVTLLSRFGADSAGQDAQRRLRQAHVILADCTPRRKTACRTRYLAEASKLFELDEAAHEPLDVAGANALAQTALAQLRQCDALIFADRNGGVLSARSVEPILTVAAAMKKFVAADSAAQQGQWALFQKANLLCLSERRLRRAVADPSSSLNAAACALLDMTGAAEAVVSLGRRDLVAFDQHRDEQSGQWEHRVRGEYLPGLDGPQVDALGSEDALLAVATLARAAGASLHVATLLASCAMAVQMRHAGHQPISAAELRGQLRHVQRVADNSASLRVAG